MNNRKKAGSKKHILVTGCPRSGTTFLGKILSLPREVGYVREPFNRDFGLAGLEHEFPYLYAGMEQETYYRSMIDAIFNGTATFRKLPPSEASRISQRIGRAIFGGGSNYSYIKAMTNPLVDRLLLKDPMISLGSEYLHSEYDMDVVVILRKPLPNIASMRRVGMQHSIDKLIRQKELYEFYLKDVLDQKIRSDDSMLEQQILLWLTINTVLKHYIDRNPRFIVVKHHELAKSPIAETKRIYQKLGLEFTPSILAKIKDYTSPKNVSGVTTGKMHVLKRNSRAIADVRPGVFSDDEERLIHERTHELVSELFKGV
ncbi:sulfotransferase [bacterium]|nr:sulfotransferase [bacterium]